MINSNFVLTYLFCGGLLRAGDTLMARGNISENEGVSTHLTGYVI